MNTNKIRTVLSSVLISSMLLTTSASIAAASPGRHNKRKEVRRSHKNYKPYKRSGHYKPYRHYYPYYRRPITWPQVLTTAIIIGGLEYHYQHGQFYRRRNGNYIIVDPPFGAVVKSLPHGYTVIRLNKRKYYHYNKIYYVKKPGGYVVVEDPLYDDVAMPRKIDVIENSPISRTQDYEYTVNIANTSGTYTPVRIVKSREGGFVGPQGEYYEEFPKVTQLQVMYGK